MIIKLFEIVQTVNIVKNAEIYKKMFGNLRLDHYVIGWKMFC
jgi:hypothetical protein